MIPSPSSWALVVLATTASTGLIHGAAAGATAGLFTGAAIAATAHREQLGRGLELLLLLLATILAALACSGAGIRPLSAAVPPAGPCAA